MVGGSSFRSIQPINLYHFSVDWGRRPERRPHVGHRQAASTADGYLSMGDWATFNGKLSDAPSDGNQYARKNAAWDVVAAPAGGASVLEVQVFS